MPPNNTDRESLGGPDPLSRTLQFTPEATQPLSTEIVMGVARASGIDPTQLHQALHDVINPSALDALFAPTGDGTSRSHGTVCFPFHGYRVSVERDGTITLQSELEHLKQTGVNLLVCGTVPDIVRDTVSARLLGDAARDRDRTVLFVLSDQPRQTALQRLADAQIPQQRAHVLSTDDPVRSATQTNATEITATMASVSGTLDDLQAAILQSLSDLEHHHDGFAPAELRFCFDSLRPFVDVAEREQLTAVLSQLCEAVEQRNGMGQFLLPSAIASEQVQTVRSLFDIIVDLRISEQGPEYRWHFQTTDFTTRWIPF